jgi:hypothetical protein
MSDRGAGVSSGSAWPLDTIPYHTLARETVQEYGLLFYMVATASFVEITSDVYSSNLIAFFRGDDEVVAWLEESWEREELHHGAALKRYVQTAWPDFDWDGAYGRFHAEFMQFCSVDQLAATRALEMAARCVVETGTAAFYRALADMSPEPVLGAIATQISLDEVRHYKHFYRFFLRYRALERPGRAAVLQTLWRRMGEVDAEDAFYAFKHVYSAANPQAEFHRRDYDAFRGGVRQLAGRYFPHEMAVKMLLKPLGLSPPLAYLAVPAVTSAARLFFR